MQADESKQRIIRLQEQNREYENEVSDLTAQLASSLEAREIAARKAAHRCDMPLLICMMIVDSYLLACRASYDEDNPGDDNFDVDALLHDLGE